jgi:hypothetical protein
VVGGVDSISELLVDEVIVLVVLVVVSDDSTVAPEEKFLQKQYALVPEIRGDPHPSAPGVPGKVHMIKNAALLAHRLDEFSR